MLFPAMDGIDDVRLAYTVYIVSMRILLLHQRPELTLHHPQKIESRPVQPSRV